MVAFAAILLGRCEVPPVVTNATGETLFQLIDDGRRLHFLLKINNIRRVTQAHIHLGRPGENGPVVAFLFGENKFGISIPRGIVEGTLTREDLVGPLQGGSINNLIREMEQGNTYVNVHSEQFPDGEIRGQIAPLLYTMSIKKNKTMKQAHVKGKRKPGLKNL